MVSLGRNSSLFFLAKRHGQLVEKNGNLFHTRVVKHGMNDRKILHLNEERMHFIHSLLQTYILELMTESIT